MGALRVCVVAAAAIAACKFAPAPVSGDDGNTIVPDAGPCQTVGTTECAGDTLRTCTTVGQLPTDETCAWGCIGATPHCAQLVPAGGGVVSGDLAGSDVAATTLAGNVIVNGADGRIGTSALQTSVRGAGTGVVNGIGFAINNGVAVFRFASLTVAGTPTLVGPNAIAFVADGAITLDNAIDARGFCGINNPGPGGFAGGLAQSSALGSGAGTGGGAGHTAGGGGGGYGATGGPGGDVGGGGPAGGASFGDDAITILVGGGGGGGGGGGNSADLGGGGGGALQVVSNTSITIHAGGGINAGGCGGKGANGGQAASGGGAGGTILLEAPAVMIDGKLAVNGGGGGGGDGGGDGSAGLLMRAAASGGVGNNNGTDGGKGGFGAHTAGYQGVDAPTGGDHSGGGGGAVGRIRINTKHGSVVLGQSAELSPDFNDAGTCTESTATVQ